MLRALAAALVVGGAAYVGHVLARDLRRRPEELQALQTALRVLVTEIDYGAVPLPEALERAAACVRAPADKLFARAAAALRRGDGAGAGAAWLEALQTTDPHTAWTRGDLEILSSLAPVLGVSHREDQLRHLQLCLERLSAAEAEAGAAAGRGVRLVRYLSVLAGLALALLAV